MSAPIDLRSQMDALYFKKAVTKNSFTMGAPIAMRCGFWNTSRMYLIGSPPVWYSPPLTEKDPKTGKPLNAQEKA
jgi:hypothetical protein